MKDKDHIKWLIIILLALVIISSILTAIIVNRLIVASEDNNVEYAKSQENYTENVSFFNVYVFEYSNQQITFLYKHNIYEKICDNFEYKEGIYDVKVKDNKVVDIKYKDEIREGKVLSYKDGNVEIEGIGNLKKNIDAPIYKLNSGTPIELDSPCFSVGNTSLQCVMEDGCVTAICFMEDESNQDMHVLIKNQDSIYYPDLIIVSDKDLLCDHILVNGGTFVASSNMQDKDMVCLSSEDGLLYIVDEANNPISLAYEGEFWIRKEEEGYVLVNSIDIEGYLEYVTPSEMPDSFSYEALKTQAVCARTYAYAQMYNQEYISFGANVDDSTAYQVYNKCGKKELTSKAVLDTRGEVIKKDGQLITCYYFSTSCGMTQSLEVWDEAVSPDYIKSVDMRISSEEDQTLDLSNEENFKNYIDEAKASYDSDSYFYRWEAAIDLSQGDYELGNIKSIQINKRGNAGCIRELMIHGEKESLCLTDENDMRKFLGKFANTVILRDGSIRENLALIPSACFYIKSFDSGMLTIAGGGYGHGIGMSQYGASALGNAGLSYKEIINFFFDQVEITT